MTRIHPLSDVQCKNIGENTSIWQFCVILPNARIGSHCNICANVFIENDVQIGNHVTIKSGVQLWDGVTIEDNVFIGPNVTFTNDLTPRSRLKEWKLCPTLVKKGATIGANATIIANCTIGNYAFIGAGSVVTKDIPDHTVWYGNPARHTGYITHDGILLSMDYMDRTGKKHPIF